MGKYTKTREITSFCGQIMGNELENKSPTALTKVVAILLGVPWVEVLTEAWKLASKLLRGMIGEGMYEVLEYEFTLELQDKEGKRAFFRKRKKVRYLQNNIIAFQDYGWGDGEHFQDYRAHPGIPVDRYKAGYRTYILLSLREVKNRGDIDEFNIQWNIKNGFLKPDGFWETDITSRTKFVKANIVFPKERPPHNLRLVENNIQRTTALGQDAIRQLPGGKWQITWETDKPRLYEHYILRWDW
jgi:hypothetical protein